MKILENIITIDLVVILFLGVALFFLAPDLQKLIIGGMVGYLGASTKNAIKEGA